MATIPTLTPDESEPTNGPAALSPRMTHFRRLATSLSLQLAEHSSGGHQMIVENLAGHVEELGDQWVSQPIRNEQTLLLDRNDILISQNHQLLGDNGLLEAQRFLQFLNRFDSDLTRASRTPIATSNPLRIACWGRGGQPGMYTSTGTTRSTPPIAA